MKPPKIPSKYLAHIGRKGGATTGPTKVRGDREYYAMIRRVGIERQRLAKNQLTQLMAEPPETHDL